MNPLIFEAYPTGADVEAMLKSSSYWPTDATKQDFARLQCDIGAAASSSEWENTVGWAPFLAKNTATVRTFRHVDSRGLVDFKGGAIAIESVGRGAQILTENANYYTEPENAISRGEAITGLEMAGGPFRGSFGSSNYATPLVVTARWGRVELVPGDVWQAICQGAALIALTQIENLQSIASISFDGFSKSYDVVGIVTQKDLVGIWGKNFPNTVKQWTRVIR